MDKMNDTMRSYGVKDVSIMVEKGRVVEFVLHNRKISCAKDFYSLLKKAMLYLSAYAPYEFEKVYMSLYLNTREFKIAQRIYEGKSTQPRSQV